MLPPLLSIPASNAENTETKTDNTGAIIGGVVAVALIAAVTVIVIVVLRSRSANYSTPKTRLVCPAKHYIPLNKAWYILASMYKMVLHRVIIALFRGSVGALATTNQSVELSKFSEAIYV